jgi:hypothetical protein
MDKRKIIMMDLILVVGSLLIIAGIVGYARPLVIAPADDFTSTETGILFEFEKAEVILIDDNLQFSSPQEIYVEDNLVVNLKPGVYYWKVRGGVDSKVRKLTIESEIELKIRDSGENYKIVNSGNDRLNVDIYSGLEEGLIGRVILDVDEGREIAGRKFVGREVVE